MQTFKFPIKHKEIILSLGAESAGSFSIYKDGLIFHSADFRDLLEENNFSIFKKEVLAFLKKERIQPDIILSDLHPLMKTTLWGQELAKKYKAQHIQIQHHHAHIFSAIGEQLVQNTKKHKESLRTVNCELRTFYGIAMDGTGYGEDEKIWGGECFELGTVNRELRTTRIGHLENQIMIGGELAIKEPARMIISILSRFLPKKEVYVFVKKYYTKNEFEVLCNQLEQNFNCLKTSSTGRILDAVSLLLGFCDNQRKYKHEPINLLEVNSKFPYKNLKPIILKDNSTSKIDSKFILETTPLFKYLIKNLHKDKKRLAATAQLYIAQGLHEIIKDSSIINYQSFASGGLTNNKIISRYFQSKNIYLNNKIHRGDAGLSFGQISWFLLKK